MNLKKIDKNVIAWTHEVLAAKDYQLTSNVPEIIQDNAWSQVMRFATQRGFIFLKIVPVGLAIEAEVIGVLSKQFQANVPVVIAANKKYHCFLMTDAGVTLYQFFQEKFQADIFIQALQHYSNLQIKTINHIDAFIRLGVPDWRLEKLSALYLDLLNHEELLLEDGLSKDEITTLKNLAPKLTELCETLADFKIQDTFGHADFHDKNILWDVKKQRDTLIDLGEVVITHPFFSLNNCLHRAKQNFALDDLHYQQLVMASLQPWQQFETQENLLKMLQIINHCWSIHSVLGEFRLIMNVDPDLSFTLRRKGRLSKNLRFWLKS